MLEKREQQVVMDALLKQNSPEAIMRRIRLNGPLLKEDGSLHQSTLKLNGVSYRCHCGCNVFHHPDKESLNLYECNSCKEVFDTE